MRVDAENGMNSCSPSSCSRSPNLSLARTTIERPSGVSSASDASWAALREVELVDAADGQELGGLAVAESDRSGLVEEQYVHVSGCLDRSA